jgi:H+/Cl- antiporter ClcA
MLKVLAVLRTIVLVFIVGYTIRAMPVFTSVANTFDEQYARCSSSLNQVVRAAWLAVAWIVVETVLGWIIARRKPAAAPPAAPAARP